jgi:hypothetical protein
MELLVLQILEWRTLSPNLWTFLTHFQHRAANQQLLGGPVVPPGSEAGFRALVLQLAVGRGWMGELGGRACSLTTA